LSASRETISQTFEKSEPIDLVTSLTMRYIVSP